MRESLDISYMGLKMKRDALCMQKVVVVGGGSSDMKKLVVKTFVFIQIKI